ncbi:MAG: alpha/beta fold hydrolase [Gemmatimonadota bacterium]|nr:MAG: alpha/beta fold hydrolase [Gemmatimonadota bacterium]
MCRLAGGGWIWCHRVAVLITLSLLACVESPSPPQSKGLVVLLHGLGRTDLSMLRMKSALADHGYRVVNVDYPSTQHSIEYLAAEELGPALERCCTTDSIPVHFVTHSMGGIVLRYYLATRPLEHLGRVVMLSPPNRGSELADWVAENPLLQRVLGPSVEQLGTDSASVPSQLGPVDFELGVIAGNRTLNPLFSRVIPGADDGKVAVENTKVEGMADFLIVPHSHTYIMMNEDVIYQVIYFLENGRFRRDTASVN